MPGCNPIFWVLLKPSFLANCFFRSSHYLAPILSLFFKTPVFVILSGFSDQRRQHFPSILFVLKRMPFAFPSTPSPRPPTSRLCHLARLFPFMQPLCRPNPRPRTSNFCLCSRLRKSFWLLSTPKMNLRMILPFRIVVVFHLISSKHLSGSDKLFQGLL